MDLVTFSKWAVNRSAVTHNRNRFNSFNNSSRPTHHPGICTLSHSPLATSVALLIDKGRCGLQFNDIFSFLYQVYYLHPLPPSFKLELNISLLLVMTSNQIWLKNLIHKLYSFNVQRGSHGSHLGCQENTISLLRELKNTLMPTIFYCFCHPTWLPHKPSIIAIKMRLPVITTN